MQFTTHGDGCGWLQVTHHMPKQTVTTIELREHRLTEAGLVDVTQAVAEIAGLKDVIYYVDSNRLVIDIDPAEAQYQEAIGTLVNRMKSWERDTGMVTEAAPDAIRDPHAEYFDTHDGAEVFQVAEA